MSDWEKFIQFAEELQAVCAKHGAGLFHDPNHILVMMTDGGRVYTAAVMFRVSPASIQYARAPGERDAK